MLNAIPGVSCVMPQGALYAFPKLDAKLYPIDLTRPPSAIGRNTPHAMQSGLLFGYVGLVEGMVARFKAELGQQTHVIATGGLAEVIARETDVIDVVDPLEVGEEETYVITATNQG